MASILTFFLAFYLTHSLTCCLAFCLAFYLTFYLAVILTFLADILYLRVQAWPMPLELAIWGSGPGVALCIRGSPLGPIHAHSPDELAKRGGGGEGEGVAHLLKSGPSPGRWGKTCYQLSELATNYQSCRRSQSHRAPATLMSTGLVPNKKVLRLLVGIGRVTEWTPGSYKRPGPLYMCTSTYTMNRKPRRSSGILNSKIPRRPSILTLYSHFLIQASNHIKPHNLPMWIRCFVHMTYHDIVRAQIFLQVSCHAHCQDICQQLEHSTFEEVGLWGFEGELRLIVEMVLRKMPMLIMLRTVDSVDC